MTRDELDDLFDATFDIPMCNHKIVIERTGRCGVCGHRVPILKGEPYTVREVKL